MASESKRALVIHKESGDMYVVALAAVWDDDGEHILGSEIVAAVGPVQQKLDLDIEGPIEPSAELFDLIDNAVNLSDDDAAWLQAEEEAGRLLYPIGVR